MGCASSAYSKDAVRKNLLKSHRVTSTNSIPTDEPVLKDTPEVVEKLIDVIKDTDVEMVTILAGYTKFENSSTDIILNDANSDTNSESSLIGYVEGFLPDNDSINSNDIIPEEIESYKVEDNYMPGLRDCDSLGTSSPESEIEQALANDTGQNPPTPKPTMSELEDLYKTSNLDHEIISNFANKDTNKITHSVVKTTNNPVILNEPTEWEKQADLLANTRKYNPVEAMRKLKRESTRASSSLPHRDFKPRNNCVDDCLNDFYSQRYSQCPVESVISSAKSGRSGTTDPSAIEPDTLLANKQNNRSKKKFNEASLKKNDDTTSKRKELHLTVAKNGNISSSPSHYKVRERCAVCCNKYKT